jgi:glucan phosphoethanolaminetransferase (alkaline phosphatase superfamily)
MLFLPSWTERKDTDLVELDAFKMEHIKQQTVASSTPTFYIAILAIASAVIAFYSISRYRNRLLQIKLGALNSLLMAGVLGLIVYFSKQGEDIITNQNGEHQLGTYLPMAAMICNLIANRFIRRDENLVRSADRMR